MPVYITISIALFPLQYWGPTYSHWKSLSGSAMSFSNRGHEACCLCLGWSHQSADQRTGVRSGKRVGVFCVGFGLSDRACGCLRERCTPLIRMRGRREKNVKSSTHLMAEKNLTTGTLIIRPWDQKNIYLMIGNQSLTLLAATFNYLLLLMFFIELLMC